MRNSTAAKALELCKNLPSDESDGALSVEESDDEWDAPEERDSDVSWANEESSSSESESEPTAKRRCLATQTHGLCSSDASGEHHCPVVLCHVALPCPVLRCSDVCNRCVDSPPE